MTGEIWSKIFYRKIYMGCLMSTNHMRLVTKGNWRHVEKFYVHVSPSTTLKDSFATLDFDQSEANTNDEAPKV